MDVATPMNSMIGRMTSSKSVNPSPNADACATSARATIAPVNVERNIPARLNASFHASAREASRLQCSVDKIWSRIDGDASAVGVASPARGADSTPSPMPAPTRSKDISSALTLFLSSHRREPLPHTPEPA
jgi:hypothetical protein